MNVDDRDRTLLDQLAIRETLLRYARGIDRRDWPVMLSVFTEDVHAVFQGIDLGRDRQAILDYINAQAANFEILSSVHALNNMHIDVREATASAETTGIGYLTYRTQSGAMLRMRSLRYVDQLVRSGNGQWLIEERILTNDWEVQLPAQTFDR